MRNQRYRTTLLVALLAAGVLGSTAVVQAQVRLGDVCRIKGQEENVLHGFGLVVGLKGTGDGDKPATRALAQTMMLMGNSIPHAATGDFDLTELKNAKNVALVFVTATVPGSGGRQGGRMACTLSAISAKSLAGGTLLVTPLLGPVPGDRTTYALASGPITLDDPTVPTVAKVHQGCQLQTDFRYEYQQNGYITLVLKENHASFKMAQMVQFAVNQYRPKTSLDPDRDGADRLAVALDAKSVLVKIPEEDSDNPVDFVARLLGLPIEMREVPGTRVVISERSQVIVVGEEVTIRPVAIAHKNLTVEAGGQRFATFTSLERVPDNSDPTFALRSLVTALNALKVDTADIIEIIKSLDREGALLGELIIE